MGLASTGAGDWRGAVTAYRSANMWEDALRVAKKASGEQAAQQVKSGLFSLIDYAISLLPSIFFLSRLP